MEGIMKRVLLEVVAPMLSSVELNHSGLKWVFSSLGLNEKDRNSCVASYPQEWKEAVVCLSDWIDEISRLYRHRILIRIIDAQSPLGFWKQLRHSLFTFPAFIIDRKYTYIGWDSRELEEVIDARVRRPPYAA